MSVLTDKNSRDWGSASVELIPRELFTDIYVLIWRFTLVLRWGTHFWIGPSIVDTSCTKYTCHMSARMPTNCGCLKTSWLVRIKYDCGDVLEWYGNCNHHNEIQRDVSASSYGVLVYVALCLGEIKFRYISKVMQVSITFWTPPICLFISGYVILDIGWQITGNAPIPCISNIHALRSQ